VATSTPRRTPPLTINEFLEMEEASPTKHEYVAGQVYALAGASARHNSIAMNIAASLWNGARGGPCRVFGSDMLLRIGDVAVYYPDVQVVCEPHDATQSYVTEPCLIVEVLSPSTQSIDLREKWLAYRDIESLQAYLIVWRDQRRVMLHYRAEDDGQWYDTVLGGESTLRLHCPEMALSLGEIYEGVDLPAN
jgi:Uma2 family endonuclease